MTPKAISDVNRSERIERLIEDLRVLGKCRLPGSTGEAIATVVNEAADELARLRVDAEKMRAFCRDALHEFWEGDGEMQDMGKRHGLLIEVEVTEPCGEACSCAEYGADFPTECYRFAPFLREDTATAPKQVADTSGRAEEEK